MHNQNFTKLSRHATGGLENRTATSASFTRSNYMSPDVLILAQFIGFHPKNVSVTAKTWQIRGKNRIVYARHYE
jgi:hypothetical protein